MCGVLVACFVGSRAEFVLSHLCVLNVLFLVEFTLFVLFCYFSMVASRLFVWIWTLYKIFFVVL